MCFKKWFHKPPVLSGTKKALLFAINNYPGTGSDLRGCLNDQEDLAAKLDSLFPDFVIRMFQDSEVTKSRFTAEVFSAVNNLVSGDVLLIHYSGHGTQVHDSHGDEIDGYDEALYLYDGALIDDEINRLLMPIPEGAKVILALDSCFSGTGTRNFHTNRFYDNGLKPRKKRRKRIGRSYGMKWIVFAGCGEKQTSADAYINGRFNGAFTFFWLKTMTPAITYKKWIEEVGAYLPNQDYDQKPELEGKEELFGNLIFT